MQTLNSTQLDYEYIVQITIHYPILPQSRDSVCPVCRIFLSKITYVSKSNSLSPVLSPVLRKLLFLVLKKVFFLAKIIFD